jgi:hypothetical protein
MSESVFVVLGTETCFDSALGVFESKRHAEEFAFEIMMREPSVEGSLEVFDGPGGRGTNAVSVVVDSEDSRIRCVVREFPLVETMDMPLSDMTSNKSASSGLSGGRWNWSDPGHNS